MAGTSGEFLCEGFVETREFEESKDELKRSTGLTDRQIDFRLEGLLWALRREPAFVAERIPNRNLWVATTNRGVPLLRIFLRPREERPTECELMWIEERF
ncbi:MAG TPA: hypothetical protein VGH60_05630 [Solirubrobacteraceae bacterium]|jgi:hypothetical protein